jgi:hypothetical protein
MLIYFIVRDQEIMAKIADNMAVRPAMTSSLRNMLIFDFYDPDLLDYYMELKNVVDSNFN